MDKSTQEYENEIESATSWEEFEKIIDGIRKPTFGERLDELCKKYGTTKGELSLDVAISQSMFYAINNGTRQPSKELVFRIGLTLGVTKEEINELLKLSNHKELYAKNKEDAIILFGLKNKKDIYEIAELLKEEKCSIQLLDE